MSHFDNRAEGWDSGDIRVNGAKTIADAISKRIELNVEMEIFVEDRGHM